MTSGFLKLNSRDFVKGLATAVIAGVFIAVVGVFSQPNFDLFTVDWVAVGHLAANAAVSAFIGYIGKNLLSDSDGKFLGRV
jgi:hypothetical protein